MIAQSSERDGGTQVYLLLQVQLCCREEGMNFELGISVDAGPMLPVHCTSCFPGRAVPGKQAALGKESRQAPDGSGPYPLPG